MPIRPKNMAERDFAEFTGVFHEIMTEGYRDYARLYGPNASAHRRNTRRDLIRDHQVKRLRAALDGKKGVHIRDGYGTTYFNFYSRWTLQVRMLLSKRRSRQVALNRTQLAFNFQHNADDAPPLGPLFHGTTNVYLGYETPEADPLAVTLVCPDGKRNAWDIPIEPPHAAEVVRFEPKAPLLPDEEELVRVPARKPNRENDEQDIQSGDAGAGEDGKGSNAS